MKLLERPKIFKFRSGITMTLVMLVCVFWDMFFKIITDGFDISVIPNFLDFNSTHNTGAAYSIFAGQVGWLIAISSVLIVAICVFNWFYKKKSIFYCVSMGMIIGGAVGNLIDRVFFGYVRDFIKFSFFSFTCNLADVFLCIGVGLFAVYLIFFADKKQGENSDAKNNS